MIVVVEQRDVVDRRVVVLLALRLFAVLILAAAVTSLINPPAWSTSMVMLGVATPPLLMFVVKPVAARVRLRLHTAAEIEADVRMEADRQEFEGSLRRAFEMTRSEPESMSVVEHAAAHTAPGAFLELLISDSSEARLTQALHVGDGRGCTVATPYDCPAVANGRTHVFASSSDLDTCPKLRGRDIGAVCVPVMAFGRPLGVMHTQFPDGEPPDDMIVERLGTLGARTGNAIGMHRSFAQSEVQAMTDPLTGLLNRRSLTEKAAKARHTDQLFAVLMIDLDHFKTLNDVYGHAVGDQALVAFSGVLLESTRSGDLVSRYGGEEFLLVLPGQDSSLALAVAERIRECLARHIDSGSVPRFTASIGIADSRLDPIFDSVVLAADTALLDAKAAGRDRVIVAPSVNPATIPAHFQNPT